MENRELADILAAKQRRRQELAGLPIEEKLRIVVKLQELAAPLLRARGQTVRCWKLDERENQVWVGRDLNPEPTP